VRRLSYAELASGVDEAAVGLRAAGIGKGDAVGVLLPMTPEAVIAAYAIAKVGALYVPLFSGFAAKAIASRLNDAQAKLVFTTDWSWRRGPPHASEGGPRRKRCRTAQAFARWSSPSVRDRRASAARST